MSKELELDERRSFMSRTGYALTSISFLIIGIHDNLSYTSVALEEGKSETVSYRGSDYQLTLHETDDKGIYDGGSEAVITLLEDDEEVVDNEALDWDNPIGVSDNPYVNLGNANLYLSRVEPDNALFEFKPRYY